MEVVQMHTVIEPRPEMKFVENTMKVPEAVVQEVIEGLMTYVYHERVAKLPAAVVMSRPPLKRRR